MRIALLQSSDVMYTINKTRICDRPLSARVNMNMKMTAANVASSALLVQRYLRNLKLYTGYNIISLFSPEFDRGDHF